MVDEPVEVGGIMALSDEFEELVGVGGWEVGFDLGDLGSGLELGGCRRALGRRVWG